MSDAAVETVGLTRYFGRKCAVDSVTLSVPRGCVFGLLGRNGCGKTTTIRMLLGLLEPTRGSGRLLGCDSAALTPEIRARVGYLAEGHQVYGWMRVRECGAFQSRFFPRWNHDLFKSVIEYFRLDPATRAGSLSRGERAGLCLALTLAPEPELLILDDPALGLDPVARRALLEAMIYVTRSAERTILFSSHMLSDVERVAERIAVVDAGQVVACCSLETFRQRVRRLVAHFHGPAPEPPSPAGLLESMRHEHEIALTVVGRDGEAEDQLRSLGADAVERLPIDLEDAFISYVGHRGRESLFVPAGGTAS